MSEGLAGIAAIVLPPLIAWAVLASSRLKSDLAKWYASFGEQRDGPMDILFELTCTNCFVLYILAQIYPSETPKEFWEGVFIFIVLWPFWLFVGIHSPAGTALKSAWRNHRQTWFKVCAGYCLSLISLGVFITIAKAIA